MPSWAGDYIAPGAVILGMTGASCQSHFLGGFAGLRSMRDGIARSG